MSGKQASGDHHASAKAHHEQAMQHHRSAATHYKIGKDYAHAAHQALLAHGHALRAFDESAKAAKLYAEQKHGAAPSEPAPHASAQLTSSADRHAVAADLHEQAARHHNQAARHREGKNDALAAKDAFLAEGLARNAVFHGNEAAMHHVEHYGKAGPVAEIV